MLHGGARVTHNRDRVTNLTSGTPLKNASRLDRCFSMIVSEILRLAL